MHFLQPNYLNLAHVIRHSSSNYHHNATVFFCQMSWALKFLWRRTQTQLLCFSYDFPDPQVHAPTACGLSSPGWICDPSHVLSSQQRMCSSTLLLRDFFCDFDHDFEYNAMILIWCSIWMLILHTLVCKIYWLVSRMGKLRSCCFICFSVYWFMLLPSRCSISHSPHGNGANFDLPAWKTMHTILLWYGYYTSYA